MSLRSWFASMFQPRRRPIRKAGRLTTRLTLESLEDRVVPSLLVSTGTEGNGTGDVLRYTDSGTPIGSGGVFVANGSGGLTTARGIAFGPDGDFYVADVGINVVNRYNGSTGAFINAFVPSSSAGINGPEEIFFNTAHTLLYVDMFNDGSVQTYNASTGAHVSTLVPAGSVSSADGMTIGPDGNLYVVNTQGDVLRYNATTGASLGVFVSDAEQPRNLTFDSAGNMYVSNYDDGSVYKYNSSGTFLGAFVAANSGIEARGLTFGPDGNLYVAYQGSNVIDKFNGSNGAFIGTFVSGINSPIDIVFTEPPNITAPASQTATEGTSQSITLGSFTDSVGFGPWTVDVHWGDSSADTVYTENSVGSLGSQSHTYAEHGTYHPTITVTNNTGGLFDTVSFQITVADAPLTAGTINASGGVAMLTATTLAATFTDGNPLAPTTDFSGSINWGDTNTTTFTSSAVSGSGGSYTVSGSHQYATANTYNITVTINDVGGQQAIDTGSTTVVNPPSFTTTIGAGPFTYDGTEHFGGSGIVTGSGGLNTTTSNVTYSAHADGTGVADQVDAGTYYVTAHYAGDATHQPSNGLPVAIIINKAPSSTTTNGAGPFTYTGSPQPGGSGTVAGAGTITGSATLTYSANSNGTGTADQTDAGTYYVTAHYAGDANHTGSDGSAVAIIIKQAPTTTTTNGAGPFTYTGSPQPGGSGTVAGAGTITGSATLTYSANSNGTGTADETDAGTYYVTAHYAGDANHTGSDGSPVAIVINKAPSSTTTFGAGPFVADGTTHAGGSGTVTGAGGLTTTATTLTYAGDQVDAGTYYVTAHFAGDANHLSSDGLAVPIVINPPTTVTEIRAFYGDASHPNLYVNLLNPSYNRDLPWFNIHEIDVVFSAGVTVTKNDLSMTGVAVANYIPSSSFSYDSVNHIAKWVLAAPIGADRISIDLDGHSSSGVIDLNGNKLEGNGMLGGVGTDFVDSISVLPGDYNGDGVVNLTDQVLVRNAEAISDQTSAAYLLADVDGDGTVDATDILDVRLKNGTHL